MYIFVLYIENFYHMGINSLKNINSCTNTPCFNEFLEKTICDVSLFVCTKCTRFLYKYIVPCFNEFLEKICAVSLFVCTCTQSSH